MAHIGNKFSALNNFANSSTYLFVFFCRNAILFQDGLKVDRATVESDKPAEIRNPIQCTYVPPNSKFQNACLFSVMLIIVASFRYSFTLTSLNFAVCAKKFFFFFFYFSFFVLRSNDFDFVIYCHYWYFCD
jgi:hypothetical protein